MSLALDDQLAVAIAELLNEGSYLVADEPVEFVLPFRASRVYLPITDPKDCIEPRVQVSPKGRRGELETKESDLETLEVSIGLACKVHAHDTARIEELNRLAEQLAHACRAAETIDSLEAHYQGYSRPVLWDWVELKAGLYLTVIVTTWNVDRQL